MFLTRPNIIPCTNELYEIFINDRVVSASTCRWRFYSIEDYRNEQLSLCYLLFCSLSVINRSNYLAAASKHSTGYTDENNVRHAHTELVSSRT